MIIPITETTLKEYIDDIISTQKNIKHRSDNWNKRPFEIISEGLIMTYTPHKLITILNRRYDFSKYNATVKHFDRTSSDHPINSQKGTVYPVKSTKDYNRLIEIVIYFKKGLHCIDENTLNDIIHTCESCGWMFASLQNSYTLEEYKNVTDFDFTSTQPHNMYFRPKFDQEVKQNGIPNKCYHICPTRLVDKILKQGLHPKDYGRTSNHPERVYLFINKPLNWKAIARTFKESRNDTYSLLEIDTSRLYDKMKFYFDSLTMTDNPAIYTYETIPSEYISLIDSEEENKEE